jgi:phthiodiolone/phenolphthiodiolone dimycocerosates ketoreductase
MTRPARRPRVEVGLYVDPVAPLGVVGTNIRLSRLMGADDIWLGDHTRAMLPSQIWNPKTNPMARVVPDLDAFFDPTVVIARYAHRGGPRMGTSVTDPFRRSAADLARAWMTLHHTTGGRAVLGIGAGEVENTVPYGVAYEKPVSRLEDTLAALRAAWQAHGKSVTHSGEFHDWKSATFAIPTRQGTTPPVWVAAQGPRACRAAGRWGDGWINTHYGFDTWTQGAKEVVAAAEDADRDPEDLTRSLLLASVIVSNARVLERAVTLPIFVAAAVALPAAGWSRAGVEHPLGPDYAGPQDYEPELVTDDVMAVATKQMTPDLFSALMPCGTAKEIADYLDPFVARGVNHVVVINLAPIAGIRVGADSLLEQRKLVATLKRMVPGRFDPRPL